MLLSFTATGILPIPPPLETSNMKPPSLLSLNVQQVRNTLPINSASNGMSGSCNIIVRNLHPGVTDEDISKLFSQFGPLASSTVHFDQYGNSLEMATVKFCRHIDAKKVTNVLIVTNVKR